MKINFEELYSDESFIAYIEGKKDGNTEKWRVLEEKDPEFKREAEKSREIIAAVQNLHHTKAPFDKQKENIFLQRKIRLWERYTIRGLKNRYPVIKFIAIAASFLLVMSISVLTYQYVTGYHHEMIAEASFHQVIAPRGEKAEIILSDGSRIWLNSGSSLKYPEEFTRGKRKVYLEGEAFFDIEKVKNSNFTVNVNDANITVLGTQFNIKNYNEDEELEVTVVEGSVLVADNSSDISFKPLLLKPFDKASISKTAHTIQMSSTLKSPSAETKPSPAKPADRHIIIRHIDPQPEVSWKDQKLIFDNETLGEMAIKMTRWYNIPVYIQDSSLRKERYTGKFVNNENIYQVLNAIELTTPVIHEIRNNEIFIRQKGSKRH